MAQYVKSCSGYMELSGVTQNVCDVENKQGDEISPLCGPQSLPNYRVRRHIAWLYYDPLSVA